MDATTMVVAAGPTTSNVASSSGNVVSEGSQVVEFSQILGQNLGNQTTQPALDSKQAINVINGNVQLDQMIAQFMEQQVKGNQKTDVKTEVNPEINPEVKLEINPVEIQTEIKAQKQEIGLPEDLAAVIMQLMQKAGFNITEIGAEEGKTGTVDLEKVLAQVTADTNLKGQVTAELQKAINESGSLQQLADKLGQMISDLTDKLPANSPESKQLKNVTTFLAELKNIIEHTTNPQNVDKRQSTDNQNNSVKEIIKFDTISQNENSGTKITETDGNAGNQDKQITVGASVVKGEDSVLKSIKPNLEQRINDQQERPNDNYLNSAGTNSTVQNSELPKVATNPEKYSETVFNQIVKKAEVALKDGQSEMKIQLQPDFLGKVNMQIKIEAGVVTAKFAAESAQVKQLIEANLNSLKQNLADQGFKVDQLLVTIGQEKDFSGYRQGRGNAETTRRKNRTGNSSVIVGTDIVKVALVENNINRSYGYMDNAVDYVI